MRCWRARWCVAVALGYVLAAPADAYGCEPEAKDPACPPPPCIEKPPGIAGDAKSVEPLAAEPTPRRETDPSKAKRVVDGDGGGAWPGNPGVLFVMGVSIGVGGAVLAVLSFTAAGAFRQEAENGERWLKQVGDLQCSRPEHRGVCQSRDGFHSSADLAAATGVFGLSVFGLGTVMTVQTLESRFSSSKQASPQVAFRPAPGGGVLMFSGNF